MITTIFLVFLVLLFLASIFVINYLQKKNKEFKSSINLVEDMVKFWKEKNRSLQQDYDIMEQEFKILERDKFFEKISFKGINSL